MSLLNSFTSRVASLLTASIPELCHIETVSVDDPKSLLCNDGSMVSVFRIKGAYRYYAPAQEIEILNSIGNNLKPVFNENGFKLDIIFDIDSAGANDFVKNAIGGMADVAEDLNYETLELLKAEQKILADTVKPETGYLVVTTFLSALEFMARQDTNKEIANKRINAKLTQADRSSNQNPLVESENVSQTHKNFRSEVRKIVEAWVGLDLIDADEILVRIREMLYRERTRDSNWHPDIANKPYTKVPLTGSNQAKYANYDIGHPSLISQIIEEPIEKTKLSTVRYFNERYYSCLERYVAGTETELIRSLFNTIRRDVPFRCVYTLVSGSKRIQNRYKTKGALATFVAKTNPISKDIADGINYISNLINSGETVAECYLNFVVWADDEKDCVRRRKSLASCLRAWGGERQRTSQYPDAVLMSSLPAVSRELPGKSVPFPLNEALKGAPLLRPISPWENGILMFVTPELKPWVINFDRTQDYILNCVSGAMGGGKSVLLGAMAKAITLIQGSTQLPLIGTIDYGPSGSYAIQNIHDMLPERLKGYVADIKLANKPESAYNIIEPLYGNNRLTEPELNTAVSFLQRIVNGEKGNVHAQLGECITAIIESMLRDAVENPRALDKSLPGVKEIEDALKNERIKKYLVKEGTLSFKNARDALFKAAADKQLSKNIRLKALNLSKVAHKYMWPLVKELPNYAERKEIDAQIGVFYVGQAKLSGFISAAINLACERYSNILSRYPVKDYSDIRVINCDVKDICSNAREHMKKAWFLLARGLVTRQFWYHKDDVESTADPVFLNYQMTLAEKRQSQIKYFGQDEYTQAESEEYNNLIEKDVFIARKYLMYITLATQLHNGFPSRIVGLATNSFICNIPTIEVENYLKEQYKISDIEMESLRRFVGVSGVADGKGKGFLYIGKINKSSNHIIQPIVSLMPKASVWALASDAEDVVVRDMVRKFAVENINNKLSNEMINFALGESLGYPNIKDRIQSNKLNYDYSQEETINRCVSDVITHLKRNVL